jgi:LacI family transcriptional regulator
MARSEATRTVAKSAFELKTGGKSGATTQRDIARLAGVSQTVVSRVLGNFGYVSDATRARVLEASKASGYVRDESARSLVTGKSNVIALIVANVTNSFYPYLFDRLAQKVQARGREVMLFNASAGRDVDTALPALLRYRVKAAVVMTAGLQSRAAAELRGRGIQTVMLNRYSLDLASSTVACDNVAGGRTVADAFLDAGLTNLAYIGGGSMSSTNMDRRKGFLDRLAERGVDPVFTADGSFSRDWGYEAAILLKGYSDLQGVFCADDDIAMGVADRLRYGLGKRIPQEIAVVGYDDIPAASWSPYALSTIRQPINEMVEHTLDLLERPPSDDPVHVRLAGDFIRRSTF